ncbi:MAG: hypothetical protein R2789_01515 [Microthrixaceae bacterium]
MRAPLDPSNADVDVVGIGNALVDVLSHESEEFIDSLGVSKGAMTLIDEERAGEIYDLTGPAVEISGVRLPTRWSASLPWEVVRSTWGRYATTSSDTSSPTTSGRPA